MLLAYIRARKPANLFSDPRAPCQAHLRFIGVDEKAVKKGHRFFTVVSDLETSTVIWVGHGRKRSTLDQFWEALSNEERAGIEGVAMDMWPTYFESTLAALPGAAHKASLTNPLVKHLVHAVDPTRRTEVRQIGEDGRSLKRTRYTWLHRHMQRSCNREVAPTHRRVARDASTARFNWSRYEPGAFEVSGGLSLELVHTKP